jgi:hypothetical protein
MGWPVELTAVVDVGQGMLVDVHVSVDDVDDDDDDDDELVPPPPHI